VANSSCPACIIPVSCFGLSNGSATVHGLGGTTPYSYSWSHNTSLNSPTANNLIAGGYTVTITDFNGCTATTSINISQPSAPIAIVNPAVVVNATCFGVANGRIDITVNGGTQPYTYVWSNGSSTQDLNNILAGNYRVTVTDANNCIVISPTYIVNQPAQVLLTASNIVNTQCNSSLGSVVLTSSNNGQIVLNGDTLPSGSVFNGLSAGYYTAYTIGTCPVSLSFNISNLNSTLSATVTVNNPDCNGLTGSAILNPTGGTAPYTYLLNGNAETDAQFENLEVGNYNAIVTDVNGCTFHVAFAISEPLPLLVDLISTQNASCAQSNDGSIAILAHGGTYPYTYLWNNGLSTNAIAGLAAGQYFVTVTDHNGCSFTDDYTITAPSAIGTPSFEIISQPTCSNPLATISIENFNPLYTYIIHPNNNVTLNVVNGLIMAPTGDYTIYASNGICNSIVAQFEVSAQPETPATPIVGLIQHPTCSSELGQFSILNYNDHLTYLITPNGDVDISDLGIVTAPSGTYQVSAMNSVGCQSSVIEVVLNPQPSIPESIQLTQPSLPTCAHPYGVLQVINFNNDYDYIISPSTGVTLDLLGNITAPPGSYTIYASNGVCSSLSMPFVINGNPNNPDAPLAEDVIQPSCTNPYGSFIIPNYNSSYTYNITPNGGSISDLGIFTGLPGTYLITATNGISCVSLPLIITINPQPTTPQVPTISSIVHPTCSSPLGQFSITNYNNSLTYTFTPSLGVAMDALGNVEAPAGTYSITASNGVCTSNAIEVVVNSNPETPITPILNCYYTTNMFIKYGYICNF
jgi:hypothetical protein